MIRSWPPAFILSAGQTVMLLASMIGSHAFSNILDNISETLASRAAK